jgi:hypothetical protein
MSQLDISSTRQFEGIGMGLYTLQQIAKIHHGTVHLDSNPKRTRITLNIACLSVMNNEELIAAITELKEIVQASNRQLNGRMSEMENRMAELSGSVAVVLNRSAENKKETGENIKKNWRLGNITVSNSTGD